MKKILLLFVLLAFAGSAYAQDVITAEVQPGMRYRDYEQFYNPLDYVYAPGDRYSPVAGGICSWLIPGLGQMVSGEVGRGFAYFGGALGCAIITSVGAMVAAEGLIYVTSGQDYGRTETIIGAAIMYAGLAGLIVVDICAIVDGIRVAKIKNMYERDVRALSSVMSIELEPYIATVAGVNPTNVYGASLRITF